MEEVRTFDIKCFLSGENDNTWYGIGANETYQAVFEVYADETVPLNSEVLFTISWGYSPTSPCYFDCAEQANEEYSTIVGHPSIIIWDPSNQHISGTRLTQYFEQNNIFSIFIIILESACQQIS